MVSTMNGFEDGSGHRHQDGPMSLMDDCPIPLKVAIVGAGIGGLMAAIGLRRQGHEVNVYEQSRFANEIGAAVHLAPNANGILRRWGIYAEEFGANPMDRLIERLSTGNVRMNLDLSRANTQWQHPWLLVHRANLHDHLKKIATAQEGEGKPVGLHTSSKVVELDPAAGSLTLGDSTVVLADILVGADGIYSTTRKYIQDAHLFSSGKAAFRFLIPRSVAEADILTAPLVQHPNALCMWYGDDRRVVMYPCNDNQLLNFVCIHPDSESHASKSDEWNKQCDIEQVLKVYEGFDPAVRALISKVDPSTLRVWQLLDMEALPTWTTGKLVLLGDAAHPFTPHQGQGAGQALEDAAALSIVLPRGTAPEAISERLKLYEEIRYERAHSIQQFSREAGRDWTNGMPPLNMASYTNHNFGHDEIDHASDVFKRWKWTKQPGLSWRTPIAFGPFPGPQRDRRGRQRLADDQKRTFVSVSVKFQTSRTFLETIFPTAQFQFHTAATVATASFITTRLDNVAWLGGKGYTSFGLYVHGVQYAKKDGSIINGTYLPVMFENLLDSIVLGREELGMPKVFCDIETSRQGHSYSVEASWGGATFARIELDDLSEDDYPNAEDGTIGGEADDAILTYRYIPAVGEPGKADAEYACVMPHHEGGKIQKAQVKAVSRTKRASIKIHAQDWETLPTLHHITSVLAEIPIYSILGAKVVEGNGVPDAISCKRIE